MITSIEGCKLFSIIVYLIKKILKLIFHFFFLGAIQDMTLLQLFKTHCIITWNPPFQYMQYGSFDGYIMMCNISNTNTIIISNTTQKLYTTVLFLKPYIPYICCVTPQWTTNGIGKTLCINFTTLQDGK